MILQALTRYYEVLAREEKGITERLVYCQSFLCC